MLLEKMKGYRIILASASPRRRQLLESLGLIFEVHPLRNHEEDYPAKLVTNDVALFLARQKSFNYEAVLGSNEILITADTTVVKDQAILHKPSNEEEAFNLLEKLSDGSHTVTTGIYFRSADMEHGFESSTTVTFDRISRDEINYYIQNFKPFDKAGGYGIQEWIGLIAVKELKGSFYNVMGLPVQRLYRELEYFINKS